MRRPTVIALAAGGVSALVYLSPQFGFALAIVFTLFTALPLYAVGLSLGGTGLAIASGGAIATLIVITAALGHPGAAFEVSVVFAVLFLVPIAVLTRQALLNRAAENTVEWYPAGRLLVWLAGLGMALAAATTGYFVFGGGDTSVREFVYTMLGSVPQFGDAERQKRADQMVALLPSAIPLAWMLMHLINGLLAQKLLVRAGHNARPSPSLTGIQIPTRVVWLFAVAAAAAIIPGDIGRLAAVAAVVLALPVFVLGLAVIHAAAARLNISRFFLSAFYIVLILSGWLALSVVLLGLAEPLFRLRNRLARKSPSTEE